MTLHLTIRDENRIRQPGESNQQMARFAPTVRWSLSHNAVWMLEIFHVRIGEFLLYRLL